MGCESKVGCESKIKGGGIRGSHCVSSRIRWSTESRAEDSSASVGVVRVRVTAASVALP